MPTKADEFDLEEGEANPWSDDDEEPVVESQDMEVDEDDGEKMNLEGHEGGNLSNTFSLFCYRIAG